MRSWHFFRCPRCGDVFETVTACSWYEHPCPNLRNTNVVCRGFDPGTEAEEATDGA